MTVYFQPVQDIQIGTRASRAQYQYTLVGTDAAEVALVVGPAGRRAAAQRRRCATSRRRRRKAACARWSMSTARRPARLGVSMQAINDTLNDAFGQRQISTIYGQANQYRVVLEAAPQYQRDPSALSKLYVPANIPSQPLSTSSAQNSQPLIDLRARQLDARRCRSAPSRELIRTTAPLAIAHQEQFPVGDAQLQSRARRRARRCGRRSSRRPSATSACRHR